MQDGCITYIDWNLSALLYDTTVGHITAGGDVTIEVYDIADMNILEILRADRGNQNLLSIFHSN